MKASRTRPKLRPKPDRRRSAADSKPRTPDAADATCHRRKKDPTWLPAVEYFQAGQPFEIGDIAISPFTIPHDAADPVGFVFCAEGVRMALCHRPWATFRPT